MRTDWRGTAARLFLLCLILSASAGAQEGISAANDSVYVGDGRWEWTIFIRAPARVLDQIKCVEYTLHPTFPPPLKRPICARGSDQRAFALNASGWGTFVIPIRIVFRDGKVRLLKHNLVFGAPQAPKALPITAGNVAREERKGWWKWTVYIEGPEQALAQIRCVEYTLHPTFPNPVREVCDRGKGRQAFPLSASGWGTFQVNIRVFLRDGRTQELQHQLRF